jgi:hypothetical protein
MTKFDHSETFLLNLALVELGAKGSALGGGVLVRVRGPLHDDSALTLEIKVEADLANESDTPQLELDSPTRILDLDDAKRLFRRPDGEVKDERVLGCRVETGRRWKVARDGMKTGMGEDVVGRKGEVVVMLFLRNTESRSEGRVREDGDAVGQAHENSLGVGDELSSYMSMGGGHQRRRRRTRMGLVLPHFLHFRALVSRKCQLRT